MVLLLKTIIRGCLKITEIQDPRTRDYFPVSPFFIFPIIGFYLYFVLNWGPKFMKNRQPYNVESLIKIYNFIQVIFNSLIVLMCVKILSRKSIFCLPTNFSQDPDDMFLLNISLLYYCNKLFDFFDTIFFVLRKKFNQASFLHVYHHVAVIFMAWVGCNWQSDGHGFFLLPINSFVHIVMYLYYLLTSIDSCKEWAFGWKKFVTQIQLLQHFLLFGLFIYPFLDSSCNYEKFFCYLMVPQCTLMILLFGEFYIKTHIIKKKQ